MNLTGNQAVNLLWVHYTDPLSPLELKEAEVTSLELEIVYQYSSIETELKEKLIPTSKDDLIDFLRNNPSKSIFKLA